MTVSTAARRFLGASSAGAGAANATEEQGVSELRVTSALVRFPAVPSCTMLAGAKRCVQVSCRYHLSHPDPGGRPLSPTRDCALAVANEGPRTLEEIAQLLGMTRERVRQIEEAAIAKLRSKVALTQLYSTIE
jgi:hypothetical protein